MTRGFDRTRTRALLACAVLASGCGGGTPEASEEGTPRAAPAEPRAPIECSAVEGTLPAGVMASSLAGEYTLVLLGEDGTRSEGALTLAEQAAELRTIEGPGGAVAANTTMPLYGWTDVDASIVGGVIPGDAGSMDPAMPGIAVMETTGQALDIMMRLGSEANERGVVRFDGAYMVLRVQSVDGDGFGGTWTSGVQSRQSEGPFCAVRN